MTIRDGGDDQRVDFQHRHVRGDEGLVELAEQLAGLLGEVAGQTQRRRQLQAVEAAHAGHRVDAEGDDLLRRRVGNLFNVHAALGGGDDRDPARFAIDQQ